MRGRPGADHFGMAVLFVFLCWRRKPKAGASPSPSSSPLDGILGTMVGMWRVILT